MKYRWKPSVSQKREYIEKIKEKESLNTFTTNKAIRNGCFLKFYNISKGRIIEGNVIKESYGEKTGQHTFTIQECDGNKINIKGRNLYPNILEHIQGKPSKQVSI
jgi:hypothetical protein